jgi:hypothetical protein
MGLDEERGKARKSKLGERLRAHERLRGRRGSLRSPRFAGFQAVSGRPKAFFLRKFRPKWSSPVRGLAYPWSMPRSLFDVGDPLEARTEHRPGAVRRAAIVPVRLTEGERDQLAEVARDLGISLSTYMRQAVLSRPLPPRRAVRPIPEVNRETYHSLGRLAADVNVIARRMAERRREPGARDVLEALELVTRFLGTVRAEVLGTTLTPEGGAS